MRYFRSAAFARQYRKLPADRQAGVDEAILKFDALLSQGRPSQGIGLKELRPNIWEIRAGLLDRILFSRSGDVIELLLVGTHEELKRHLRRL